MFERRLAWRYIKAQKRHSILTVCSIAIALALMTMLFTMFSTAIGCFRDIAHENGDYHIDIAYITLEQAQAVAAYVGDSAECTIQAYNEEIGVYEVRLLFNGYIGDRNTYEHKLLRETGIQLGKNYFEDGEFGLSASAGVFENETLMALDMVDLAARLRLVQIFGVFYIFIIFFVMALRLVIDTAFEVSSKERERQFGVLQSIGATPKQTAGIITFEGLMLSVIGIPIGVTAGIGLGYLAYRAVLGSGIAEAYFTAEEAAKLLHFHINPLLLLIGAVTGLVWVLLSAYGTGMRIVRMSPVQAISARSNTVKKVRKHSLFGLLFGWIGKLAARNNLRQKKRYLITVISLTVSITLFAMTSMVLEFIKVQYQDDLEMVYGTTSDFRFYCGEKETTDMTYKEQVEQIVQSGYFDNIYLEHYERGRYWRNYDGFDDYAESMGMDLSGNYVVSIGPDELEYFSMIYFDDNGYKRLFDGEPPVSYEELTEMKGYILLKNDYVYKECRIELPDSGKFTIEVSKTTAYTAEEYAAFFPNRDPSEFSKEEEPYFRFTDASEDFEIVCAVDMLDTPAIGVNEICLISTIDALEESEYKHYCDDDKYMMVSLYGDLAKDASYFQAMDFAENTEGVFLSENIFVERQKLLTTISAIKIILAFLIIMIALIAIVNMVNILSTGILNRRGEIAAMQCIGMTQRQLYKMTIVECLQYVLGSGVTSVAFCELLIGGTRWLMDKAETLSEFGYLAQYSTPLPKIAAATAVSFAVALIASLIPLRRMQKNSLVDQIRSVE